VFRRGLCHVLSSSSMPSFLRIAAAPPMVRRLRSASVPVTAPATGMSVLDFFSGLASLLSGAISG
jgi:hypothetical protein